MEFFYLNGPPVKDLNGIPVIYRHFHGGVWKTRTEGPIFGEESDPRNISRSGYLRVRIRGVDLDLIQLMGF